MLFYLPEIEQHVEKEDEDEKTHFVPAYAQRESYMQNTLVLFSSLLKLCCYYYYYYIIYEVYICRKLHYFVLKNLCWVTLYNKIRQ